jgi:hypothetical protein
MGAQLAARLQPIADWFAQFNLPEPIVHWGHPAMMGIVIFVLGTYTAWAGWQGRTAEAVETKQKARADHKKLAPLPVSVHYPGLYRGHPVPGHAGAPDSRKFPLLDWVRRDRCAGVEWLPVRHQIPGWQARCTHGPCLHRQRRHGALGGPRRPGAQTGASPLTSQQKAVALLQARKPRGNPPLSISGQEPTPKLPIPGGEHSVLTRSNGKNFNPPGRGARNQRRGGFCDATPKWGKARREIFSGLIPC